MDNSFGGTVGKRPFWSKNSRTLKVLDSNFSMFLKVTSFLSLITNFLFLFFQNRYFSGLGVIPLPVNITSIGYSFVCILLLIFTLFCVLSFSPLFISEIFFRYLIKSKSTFFKDNYIKNDEINRVRVVYRFVIPYILLFLLNLSFLLIMDSFHFSEALILGSLIFLNILGVLLILWNILFRPPFRRLFAFNLPNWGSFFYVCLFAQILMSSIVCLTIGFFEDWSYKALSLNDFYKVAVLELVLLLIVAGFHISLYRLCRHVDSFKKIFETLCFSGGMLFFVLLFAQASSKGSLFVWLHKEVGLGGYKVNIKLNKEFCEIYKYQNKVSHKTCDKGIWLHDKHLIYWDLRRDSDVIIKDELKSTSTKLIALRLSSKYIDYIDKSNELD